MSIELILLAIICLVVSIDLVMKKRKVISKEIVDKSDIDIPKPKKNFWFAILLCSTIFGLINTFLREWIYFYISPTEFIQLLLEDSLSLINGDLYYSIINFIGGFLFFFSGSIIYIHKKKFIKKIKQLTNDVENGIGFCYWGGELISWKGNQSIDASPWENLALFDFENKALPVLREFKTE